MYTDGSLSFELKVLLFLPQNIIPIIWELSYNQWLIDFYFPFIECERESCGLSPLIQDSCYMKTTNILDFPKQTTLDLKINLKTQKSA